MANQKTGSGGASKEGEPPGRRQRVRQKKSPQASAGYTRSWRSSLGEGGWYGCGQEIRTALLSGGGLKGGVDFVAPRGGGV